MFILNKVDEPPIFEYLVPGQVDQVTPHWMLCSKMEGSYKFCLILYVLAEVTFSSFFKLFTLK